MAQDPVPDWRTCAADWYVAYREPVIAALRAAFPDVSSDLLYDAFVQGTMEIAQKPEALDPSRGSLLNLLVGAARRALTSPRRSDSARRRREERKGKELVACHDSAARDLLDRLVADELAPLIRAELARTDEDRRYLELWEQEIDDVAQVAAALGVSHLPPAQQKKEIQRMHKRVMKRLERLRARYASEEDAHES